MKLFIGFDIQNKNIKILNAEKVGEPAAAKLLPFNSRIFTDEFYTEFRSLMQGYYAENPTFVSLPTYLILPNASVGFETFNVPNMSPFKMMRSFEAELINLYEDGYKNKKINHFQLSRTKQSTTYAVVYFDKNIVEKLDTVLAEFKVIPKITTYSGNASMNCAYALSPKLRGKSFIFADVHAEYTEIVVSSKGVTLGFATIPHGTDILKTDEVVSEYMVTNHDVGEIAVINAREVAKARALTLAGDAAIPENATIDDFAVNSEEQKRKYSGVEESAQAPSVSQPVENVENAEPEEPDPEEEIQDGDDEGGKIEYVEVEEGDAEFYESEEEEQKRLAELAKPKVKKVKVFRKTPKRYPKFMSREFPQTPEGFQYENWRIILKWILLYARSATLSEYIASPEFIVVNLPQELNFLIDKTNEEQTSLKFQPLTAELPAEIRDNLNLYGGIYADRYNKKHNY